MRKTVLFLFGFGLAAGVGAQTMVEGGTADSVDSQMAFSLTAPEFRFTGSGGQSNPRLGVCSFHEPCALGTQVRIMDYVSSEDRGVSGVLTLGGVSTPYYGLPSFRSGAAVEMGFTLTLPTTAPAGNAFQMVVPITMTGGINIREINFSRLLRGTGMATVTLQYVFWPPPMRTGYHITRIHYDFAPPVGARTTLRWPREVKKVVAGPDRLYALTADGAVAMFGPNTLASNFGGAIVPQVSGLREVTALGLYFDRTLLIAGTLNDALLGSVMFVQAWAPSQVQAGGLLLPAQLLWTWKADMTSETTSVAGNSAFGSCVYVGGVGRRTLNGSTVTQGLVVKLQVVGAGAVFHWAQYVAPGPSRVSAISTSGGFSNVQATGWVMQDGTTRGFQQVFAESGGTPGPRDIWPASSFGVGIVMAANRGVFVLGAVNGEARPVGPPNQSVQLLKRYSFDGSPRWTQPFIDPGPTVYRRLAAGIGADDTGLWTGANLEYASGPSRLFVRHVGFDQTVLSASYIEEPKFFVRDLTARGTAAYLAGLDGPVTTTAEGFVIRVSAP